MPKPRPDDSDLADRERLAMLCEEALAELMVERSAAKLGERCDLDSQIETFREMLHWARSKH